MGTGTSSWPRPESGVRRGVPHSLLATQSQVVVQGRTRGIHTNAIVIWPTFADLTWLVLYTTINCERHSEVHMCDVVAKHPRGH